MVSIGKSPSSFTAHDKAVVGTVVAVLFTLVVVILALVVRYMRRQRLSLRADPLPPRYDTRVTPFPLQSNEGQPGRVASAVARFLNKIKWLEQTSLGQEIIPSVGSGNPRSEAVTLSEPPPYSATAQIQPVSMDLEGRRAPRSGTDSKRDDFL